MNLAYPWRIEANGLTAGESDDSHIRSMIEQLLLTNAGERVNQPGFGAGLSQLIFAPNSLELAATLQLTLQAAVTRYLADLIDVAGLAVSAVDERLMVEISYRVRGASITDVAVIELPMAGS